MQSPGPSHAVVLAADAGFTMQLSVALAGLAAHGSRRDPLHVFVLTSDIAAEDRHRIAEMCHPGLMVEFVPVDPRWFDGLRMADYLPVTSAFRLMIGEAIAPSVQRAVYLDADVLVRHHIDELLALDLGGAVLAAVPDAGHPWVATVHSLPWRKLGLDPAARYFNAGVLVVDVARWRADGVGAKAMELLRGHRFAYSDQCALNVVANGQFHVLDARFNAQADHFAPKDNGLVHVSMPVEERLAAVADPVIVHFCNGGAMPSRPWFRGAVHPFAGEWLATRAGTPYAAVPLSDLPSPRKVDVARRRLRRAAYMLARG